MSAPADPKRIKTLKVKTAVCKRLAREKEYYQKEAVTLKERVEKMKQDGKDEYDVRKQLEVFAESEMMIPDCERKLAVAWDDLTKLMESEADLADSAEYKAATLILVDTRAAANR